MLTGWVCVRNGSNGIDFFMCGPRSFRMRMWIGIWPPSKCGAALGARARARALLPAAGGLARARAFAAADALARPAAAGSGREAVQPDRCSCGASLLRGAHLPSLTSTRWRTACSMPRACCGVLDLDRVSDAAQAERAQRVELFAVGAVARAALGDAERGHQRRSRLGAEAAACASARSRLLRRLAVALLRASAAPETHRLAPLAAGSGRRGRAPG